MKLRDLIEKLESLKDLQEELRKTHQNKDTYRDYTYDDRVYDIEHQIDELLDSEVDL